jgi:transcription antitermination factor NusG
MPLLPLEPCIFPKELFDASAPVPAAERWWVMHSRPRAEKALARQFLARHLPFFLPLYQKQWRSNGRLQSSYLPLFPGYIFLRGDDEMRVAALTTNLVANVLPVVDQQQLSGDLTRVHHVMESGSPLTPEGRLEPGTLVEITAGPLAGLTGKILQRGKKLHFFVEVQLLQQGVSVEIESWMFQPVQRRSAEWHPAAIRTRTA